MNTFFYKDIAYPDGVIGGKDYYNPVIYSTNERLIGVWTNNKPLYQKTLTKTINSTVDRIDISTLNIDGVHKIEGYTYNSNNGYSIPIAMYQGSNGYAFAEYDKPNESIYIGLASGWSQYNNFVITLYYTKTTDAAGSALYNNYGVPTVRYTTDEQVIGLWLGETLYRKVLDFSSSPKTISANTWIKVDNMWQIQPIRGAVVIPSSRATFEVAVDCDDNDGLYVRSWLAYSNIEYLIVEYIKTTN